MAAKNPGRVIPSLEDCIGGSYKEGFELIYEIDHENKIIEIERSSISRTWQWDFNGIECRIARDVQTYHGSEWQVRWI